MRTFVAHAHGTDVLRRVSGGALGGLLHVAPPAAAALAAAQNQHCRHRRKGQGGQGSNDDASDGAAR